MVSGQVTFGSAGTKNVYFGVNVNQLIVRSGTSFGYADSTQQFGVYDSTNNSTTKPMTLYAGGVKVLEFNVTGGWGTPTLSFNVTYASASYPFDAGAL